MIPAALLLLIFCLFNTPVKEASCKFAVRLLGAFDIILNHERRFFLALVCKIEEHEVHVSYLAEPVRHIDGDAVENFAAA